jgi:DNA-binding MarR family transcriptional regulator
MARSGAVGHAGSFRVACAVWGLAYLCNRRNVTFVSNAPETRLVDDLYDVLGLLRRRSRRLVGAPFPELALSGAQLELVRVIRRNPGVAVAHAATMLGLAPNTVSTLVGQLVALEVVVRDRDERDRRLACLHLTPGAREALEQWRDRRAHATAAALDGLDDDERARLADALPLIARVAAALPETPALKPAGP